MTLYKDDKMLYRLHVMTRPELDSDSLVSVTAYEAGMDFPSDELPGDWEVAEVLFGPDGERDTVNVQPKRTA